MRKATEVAPIGEHNMKIMKMKGGDNPSHL